MITSLNFLNQFDKQNQKLSLYKFIFRSYYTDDFNFVFNQEGRLNSFGTIIVLPKHNN